MDQNNIMAIALLSSLAYAPAMAKNPTSKDRTNEKKEFLKLHERPYKSDNLCLDKVLERYWNAKPTTECGEGVPLKVHYKGNTFEISVDIVCFGGGDEHVTTIHWGHGGTSETFVDANLDGKLNEHTMFATIPDRYILKSRIGTAEVSFADATKKDWYRLKKSRYKLTPSKINGL